MLQSHSESFAHWDGECMLPPEQQEAFMQVIESSALPTTIYKHIQTRLTYDRAFKMQTARYVRLHSLSRQQRASWLMAWKI